MRIASGKIVPTACKLCVSLVLLGYIVYRSDVSALFSVLGAVHGGLYLAALGLFMLSLPLRTLRWSIFLKHKGVRIGQPKLLALYFIGMFFNTFLPTMIGGDAVRVYLIHRDYRSSDIPALSVVVERLCGIFTMFLIGGAASLYWMTAINRAPFAQTSFAVCASATVLFIMFSLHRLQTTALAVFSMLPSRALFKTAERWACAFSTYFNAYRALAAGIVLSVLNSLLIILVGYLLSRAIGWQLPLHLFLFAIPIITVTIILPVSFGGIGLRESAFYVVFSQFGVAGAEAVALALLWYSINLVMAAAGFVIYMLYKNDQASRT